MINKGIITALIELVYPPDIYCICCGAVIKGDPYALCQSCMKTIVWAGEKTCDRCGKILQEWNMMKTCMDCKDIPHAFDKGFTCARYDDMTKKVIHDLKYGGKGYIGENIGWIISERLKQEDRDYDLLVPVPMHARKQKKRGYNQADLIAKRLSDLTGIPCESNTLVRVKTTESMARLSAGDRRINLVDAFGVIKPGNVDGKRILLVDDVYTTGSTADGCAKCLREAGANSVDIITFAAGQNTFNSQTQGD